MKAILFLLLLTFMACAQNSRKYADVDDAELLSKATELDQSFKQRPSEVKYNASVDLIMDDTDSFNRETLGQDSKVSGFVNEILILCNTNEVDQGLNKADTQYYQYKSHPDYWNAVGICYYKKNQFRKALLYLQKCLDIDANYAPAINSFGLVYLAQKKINKAYEAFSASSKKSPTAATPRLNMAQLLMSYGLYGKAETLISNLSDNFKVKTLHAIINFYTKDKDSALADLKKLSSQNDSDPLLSLNYGLILAHSGKKSDAKKVLRSVQKNLITKEQYQLVEKIIEGEL